MKSIIRRSLFVICCFAFAEPCLPASLDEQGDSFGGGFVSKTIAVELLQGKLLNDVQFGEVNPGLMPDNVELRSIFAESIASLTPSMLVESLFLYKKPASYHKAGWTGPEKTAVLNVLVSISTLSGIEYYSRSRGRMRTFYEESSVINDPRQKLIQDDPVFLPEYLPSKITLYARQKDLSFGDNVYRYDYFIRDGAIIFTQKNCNAISYGIVPLAAKEKLCVLSAVIDAGEYFLIYAASMTKAPPFSGLKKKAGDSFVSRAEALIKWFTLRMGGADTE
ncbi:MAG: hypothetical protein LBD44_01360 [Spirochaetaceae bacterium]|jgi:hypothetical protein|nr:hypothetical protein [Spirochaetaceae bacterium]